MSETIEWRPVNAADLPEITALYAAALNADGGSPFAAADWLLRRWYAGELTASLAAVRDGTLIGVCTSRAAEQPGAAARITGLVAPAERGRGVGTRLLDVVLAGTAEPALIETESLASSADRLYRSRGFRQTFAEDVMSMPLGADLLSVASDADIIMTEWTGATAPRFYAVWAAAFADRPGFPGWPAHTWIEWISDDEDFRADWTLLASQGDSDLGFVTGSTGGWIVQVGVVPAARGRRISAMLMTEVFRRMMTAGETRAVLNVNVNNPAAVAVYERLGFTRIGGRARYER
jgi:mycothiol synthase